MTDPKLLTAKINELVAETRRYSERDEMVLLGVIESMERLCDVVEDPFLRASSVKADLGNLKGLLKQDLEDNHA